MSKKDRRYKLAKRGQNEDELLLTVAEQFRRREGQASISWYPGHIAKAEKALQNVLSRVDVVVEVRDARIPASTTHPMVDAWLKNRNCKRIVALNKVDMTPRSAVSMWEAYLGNTLKIPSVLVNGKTGGKGIDLLKREILKAGKEINDRRKARGMMPRNVRVAAIGFPNVGKSGILNRLAGQAKVKSANKAGVTKHMQWVRVEGFDLLDSPGIIPAKLVSQEVAVHLAICDDIGEASYDKTLVAAALVDEMRKVHASMRSFCDMNGFVKRYGLGVGEWSGEEYIFRLAQHKFFGLEDIAGERILDDWRKGRLGATTLEPPPTIPYHTGYYRALGLRPNCTSADVKDAYRATARRMHPDMGGDVDQWQKVLTAYKVINTPEIRQRYDAHGLVWDLKNGNYRVLKEGEKIPGMREVLDGPGAGPRYLTGSNAVRGDAKVRKGKIQLLLGQGKGGKKRGGIVTKAPPGPPPMVKVHELEDFFRPGDKGDWAVGDPRQPGAEEEELA